ncbi:MAG TPA: T9SS type A sorting domain-containing protein [Chitinophagaceae bacterium]|jgi:hypothetical protein|nr:T9SS type A sorting domain-containing protein [Chitinophagaceae bacterium]
MKKYVLLYKILFLSLPAFAQLTIPGGTQWVNSGTVSVVINNMDLVNNGTFSAANSSVKFSGNQSSVISGTGLPVFNILEVAKTNAAKIVLGKNISVGVSINFISGLLDLNNNNALLNSTAYLAGESESTRIIGNNGGYVEITQNLNAPLAANPGNLGASITSSSNLGAVTVRRGHIAQTGTRLTSSIQRYYLITPQNNSGLSATLRLKYFEAELNGQNENIAVLYQSNDNGINWTNLSQSNRNTNANYVEKTGINSLSLQTLANDVASSAVAGLVFDAKRKKPTEVELTWSTAMETNMLGFEVQRKLDNESDFTPTTFVNSKAPSGNSNVVLSYSQTDPNSYSGASYYRLKIVDQANNISYSDIKSVTGKSKKVNNNLITSTTTDSLSTMTKVQSIEENLASQNITVGPNPNNGNFWFTVSGIEKEKWATIFTIDGKIVKQFHINNLQQQQVNGLKSGIYILKVEGLKPYRIIVQGDRDHVNNYPLNNTSSIKN